MDQIVSHDDIFQCLIASEAVYQENPFEFIQNDPNLHKDSLTLNKIKELSMSAKNFDIRYIVSTYAEKKLMVVFKGTDPNNKNDIRTNLSMYNIYFEETKGRVHSGFYMRSKSIPLEFFTQKLYDGWKLIFSGHSLGAAVGALLALRLLLQEQKKESGLVENISFIGFGSPLIGDEIFAKFVNQSFKNHFQFIVNENDLIPKLLFHKTSSESSPDDGQPKPKKKKKQKEKDTGKNKKKKVPTSELVTMPYNEQFLRDKPNNSTIELPKKEAEVVIVVEEEDVKMKEPIVDHNALAKEIVDSVIDKALQATPAESIQIDQETIDYHSIISDEISEQELLDSQIEQVKREIVEQEFIESQMGDADSIFRKKSDNLKAFLNRLNIHSQKHRTAEDDEYYESDEEGYGSQHTPSTKTLIMSVDSLETEHSGMGNASIPIHIFQLSMLI